MDSLEGTVQEMEERSACDPIGSDFCQTSGQKISRTVRPRSLGHQFLVSSP